MPSKNTLVPLGTIAGASLRLLSAPLQPSQRVREPVKPTTGRVVGHFPSVKNNRMIAWESQLEQKACYTFEFSSVVSSFREQPTTIFYEYLGSLKRYTPDFELTLSTGESVYVEIKPAEKLKNVELKNKLQAISNFWKRAGFAFIVITDEELNQPIFQSNLKLLRNYLRVSCHTELIQLSRHWMQQQAEPTLGDLIQYLSSPKKAYALIVKNHIQINLFVAISADSQITTEKNHETCFFSYRIAPDFE
jgi:TnsA endonuclease N terminal